MLLELISSPPKFPCFLSFLPSLLLLLVPHSQITVRRHTERGWLCSLARRGPSVLALPRRQEPTDGCHLKKDKRRREGGGFPALPAARDDAELGRGGRERERLKPSSQKKKKKRDEHRAVKKGTHDTKKLLSRSLAVCCASSEKRR